MKTKTLITTTAVGLSCFLFAGCKPAQTTQPVLEAQPAANAVIPSTMPETAQIQGNICGKLPEATVGTILGMKVGAPSVATIESTTGSKRHSCTYSKLDDPATPIVYLDVSFKKESSVEAFKSLWDNQKVAQQKTMTSLPGVGVEAFMGQTGDQPMLFVLTDDAQYWIRLGKTNATSAQQSEQLQKLAKSITGQK